MLTLWDDLDRVLFRTTSYRPLQVGIQDESNAIMLTVEVPGVKKESLDIQVNNSILTITAETSNRKSSYAVRLPTYVDVGRIEAALADGILTVTLLKKDDAKTRKIEIKTG